MYILNRKGAFGVYPSLNQCKDVEHSTYYYHIQLVTSKLDQDGFVIDHEDIQQCIDECGVFGSCEEISKKIFKAVKKLMKGSKFYAYKSVITASEDYNEAWMEYKWFNKNPNYLMYLS